MSNPNPLSSHPAGSNQPTTTQQFQEKPLNNYPNGASPQFPPPSGGMRQRSHQQGNATHGVSQRDHNYNQPIGGYRSNSSFDDTATYGSDGTDHHGHHMHLHGHGHHHHRRVVRHRLHQKHKQDGAIPIRLAWTKWMHSDSKNRMSMPQAQSFHRRSNISACRCCSFYGRVRGNFHVPLLRICWYPSRQYRSWRFDQSGKQILTASLSSRTTYPLEPQIPHCISEILVFSSPSRSEFSIYFTKLIHETVHNWVSNWFQSRNFTLHRPQFRLQSDGKRMGILPYQWWTVQSSRKPPNTHPAPPYLH